MTIRDSSLATTRGRPRDDESRRRRSVVAPPVVVALVVMLCMAGGAVGLLVRSADRSSPSPSSSPLGSDGKQPSSAKPIIRGLVTTLEPPAASVDLPRSFVVNVSWAELQPTRGGPILDDNAIDKALAVIRGFDRSSTQPPLQVKLRVSSGIHAPDWAKSVGGPPFTVTESFSSITGAVGRFWTDEFGESYRDLQEKLAVRYDTVPEIAEVVISRCTMVFAEPFIRGSSNSETVQTLLTAGYTAEADERCQRAQIDAHAVWRQTSSGLALNPYQRLVAGAEPRTDEQFTERMMEYCRERLGLRCVLENNSIRWPPLGGPYDKIYATMKSLGPPMSFQTAAPSRIGDAVDTIRWAIRHGANAVEFVAGTKALPPGAFTELDQGLRANPESG